MFKQYKPLKVQQDTCVAISLHLALGIMYEKALQMLNEQEWREILEQEGFIRTDIPARYGIKRPTVKDIAHDASKNAIIICQCPCHLVTIIKNNYIDGMDSGGLPVYAYYQKIK